MSDRYPLPSAVSNYYEEDRRWREFNRRRDEMGYVLTAAERAIVALVDKHHELVRKLQRLEERDERAYDAHVTALPDSCTCFLGSPPCGFCTDHWREEAKMNEEEYNELLIGMEKAGWPCRLVELPDYYMSLAKEVDQLRAEVERLTAERDEARNECEEVARLRNDWRKTARDETRRAMLAEARAAELEPALRETPTACNCTPVGEYGNCNECVETWASYGQRVHLAALAALAAPESVWTQEELDDAKRRGKELYDALHAEEPGCPTCGGIETRRCPDCQPEDVLENRRIMNTKELRKEKDAEENDPTV